MGRHGHLSSRYMAFLKLVNRQKVPCESLPNVFFPEDEPDPDAREVMTRTAKKLCRSCPIVTECFTYALETNQRYGIWGATSPDER